MIQNTRIRSAEGAAACCERQLTIYGNVTDRGTTTTRGASIFDALLHRRWPQQSCADRRVAAGVPRAANDDYGEHGDAESRCQPDASHRGSLQSRRTRTIGRLPQNGSAFYEEVGRLKSPP